MKKIDADRAISFTAILVSIGTLLMVIYQTSLTRQQQRASVMPSLQIGYSVKENGRAMSESIWVSNQGLGPAFIENVCVIEAGQAYHMDPYKFLSKTPAKQEVIYTDRLYAGRIIPANDGVTIYTKKTDSTSQVVVNEVFKFHTIDQNATDTTKLAVIEIAYKSIYGEKWKVRSDQPTPIELD